MLKMRKKQLDAFAEEAQRAFEARMVGVFRESWSEAFAEQGEPAIRSFVHAWIPDGLAAGLTRERDLAQFLNVMFAVVTDLGEDPRRTPWVREVCDDPGLTTTGKIYRLQVKLFDAYEAKEAVSEAEEA